MSLAPAVDAIMFNSGSRDVSISSWRVEQVIGFIELSGDDVPSTWIGRWTHDSVFVPSDEFVMNNGLSFAAATSGVVGKIARCRRTKAPDRAPPASHAGSSALAGRILPVTQSASTS